MLSCWISWRGLYDPRGVRLGIWVDKALLQPEANKAKALTVSGRGKRDNRGGVGGNRLPFMNTEA